jgi:hypothetical protein
VARFARASQPIGMQANKFNEQRIVVLVACLFYNNTSGGNYFQQLHLYQYTHYDAWSRQQPARVVSASYLATQTLALYSTLREAMA